MTQNGKIDAEWLLLTLNDAAEELAHAITRMRFWLSCWKAAAVGA